MTPEEHAALVARLMKRHSDDLKQSMEGGYDSDPIFTDSAAALREQAGEIERLKAHAEEFDAAVAECEQLEAERDTLRGELKHRNERLLQFAGIAIERDTLRAELEGVRGERRALLKEAESLRAEVAKLRALFDGAYI